MTSHTFKQKNLSIDCIINSTHKFLNEAGEILDSRRLTNIYKHKDYDELGTHMYVAQEINVGQPSCRSLCCNPGCRDFFTTNGIGLIEACKTYIGDSESCLSELNNAASEMQYQKAFDNLQGRDTQFPTNTGKRILTVTGDGRRLVTNGAWAYTNYID